MSRPSRHEALAAVLRPIPADHTVVFANGYLARGGSLLRPGSPDFPMIGSMGLASSIGLGLAWRHPDRPVAVVDGDGNVLMGLSSMPVMGRLTTGSVLHVVVDDGSYASTGGQRTISRDVDLVAVALACGYASATQPATLELATELVTQSWGRPGAHLVRVLVSTDGEAPGPRVATEPHEVTSTVRHAYDRPRGSR